MLVKCPQCGTYLDAAAGQLAACSTCGFQALVPGPEQAEPAPAPYTVPPPTRQPSPPNLATPFAFLAGVAAVATFYLAKFVFPFLLAVVALALGLLAYTRYGRDPQSLTATVLGGVGLVLSLVAMAS